MRQFISFIAFLALTLPTPSLPQFIGVTSVSPSPKGQYCPATRWVFRVEALDSDGNVVGVGSGVLVAPDQVVTNAHVVREGTAFRVMRGNSTWEAQLTHASPEHDLCRLTVPGSDAGPLALRLSSTLRPGEPVCAIGLNDQSRTALSRGTVSGLLELSGSYAIQTTASISQGSSGGGLFDSEGRLVGITTAMFVSDENLTLAVPAEWVRDLQESRFVPLGETVSEVVRDELEAMEAAFQGHAWLMLGEDVQARKAYRQAGRLASARDMSVGAGLAHGGGLDSLGCHHDRKRGGYHCHRGTLAGRSFNSKTEAQAALAALEKAPQPSPRAETSSMDAANSRTAERSDTKTLSASQAKDHMGETATVCGKVVSTRYAASSRGQPTFLNLGKPYPEHVFTIVIWGDNRASFGRPEEEYKEKEVCVTGKIEPYGGRPQIEAKQASDIVVKGSKIKEN